MTTLITGASGFLGGHVVQQCRARGERVRVLVRSADPAWNAQGVEVCQGDLRDRSSVFAACAGIDTVHHVASLAGIWGAWSDYYAVNVQATDWLLEASRLHGVRRFVYTSSPSVTFDGRDQRGIDESAPYARRWLCHYPRSKALAEQRVLAANGREGLATCALRPHLIWGPGDRHLIPRLLDRGRRGQLRKIGSGENLIDIVHVENAALAQLLAADALTGPDAPAAGRTYFITQGEPVRCWDWINDLLTAAKLPPVARSISLAAAWGIGGLLEGVYRLAGWQEEPRMTRFLALQLGRDHYFDLTAARRDLGYEPRVSTAAGMARLVAHADWARWCGV